MAYVPLRTPFTAFYLLFSLSLQLVPFSVYTLTKIFSTFTSSFAFFWGKMEWSSRFLVVLDFLTTFAHDQYSPLLFYKFLPRNYIHIPLYHIIFYLSIQSHHLSFSSTDHTRCFSIHNSWSANIISLSRASALASNPSYFPLPESVRDSKTLLVCHQGKLINCCATWSDSHSELPLALLSTFFVLIFCVENKAFSHKKTTTFSLNALPNG